MKRRAVGLRRQRIAQAEKDVSRGLKDTEARGIPSNVPSRKAAKRHRPAR